MIDPGRRVALVRVLETARELGFLGPGPVDDHLERSLAFVHAWRSLRPEVPATMLDMGSGGGVPGLILAEVWTATPVLLLDGSERRVAFLHEAISVLHHGSGHGETRVRALAQRAEDAARSSLRGGYDLVTARGFAAPAVTAECGAPLLAPDGLLLVSEPPGGAPDRWPTTPLADLGLRTGGLVTDPAAIQILVRTADVPDRYPRRVGIPAKRPLWG
jgi:16S rRNA (guanine527-N7)-methyltransferase